MELVRLQLWRHTAIDDRPACDLYQWFLYVCGNLVGLGNPLTNVGPKSGNHMAEILDLMVAVEGTKWDKAQAMGGRR